MWVGSCRLHSAGRAGLTITQAEASPSSGAARYLLPDGEKKVPNTPAGFLSPSGRGEVRGVAACTGTAGQSQRQKRLDQLSPVGGIPFGRALQHGQFAAIGIDEDGSRQAGETALVFSRSMIEKPEGSW